MKRLNSVETDQYSLEVIECDCGYHMGIDATFLDQVRDFVTKCPSCGKKIKTKDLIPESDVPTNCSFCGKSFRGHEPLTDDKGNYFHQKCAPKVDVEKTKDLVKEALYKGEFFRCPWCGEVKPISVQCSKGYCRKCSSCDC